MAKSINYGCIRTEFDSQPSLISIGSSSKQTSPSGLPSYSFYVRQPLALARICCELGRNCRCFLEDLSVISNAKDRFCKPLAKRFVVLKLLEQLSVDALSGTKHRFALASIQNVTDTLIEAVPFIVGNLVRKAENGFELPLHSSMEVAPDDIDQFSGIDFTRPVSKREQDQLKEVPEKRVKEILCDLFGENHIQNDWGRGL